MAHEARGVRPPLVRGRQHEGPLYPRGAVRLGPPPGHLLPERQRIAAGHGATRGSGGPRRALPGSLPSLLSSLRFGEIRLQAVRRLTRALLLLSCCVSPAARLRLPAITVSRKGRVAVKSASAEAGAASAGGGDGGEGPSGEVAEGPAAEAAAAGGKKGPATVPAKRVALGATPVALTCGLYKACPRCRYTRSPLLILPLACLARTAGPRAAWLTSLGYPGTRRGAGETARRSVGG